ncbi:MAG TPA: substrate-binding domain-containing protein, partial [Candidatus Elarobacter sp.]
SQLGGTPGPIVAYLPEEGTDEARVLAQRFALGTSISSDVHRLASGTEIAHAVSGAGAPGAVAMVGFSASVAAKVVRLEDEPAPSVVSIADQRYPLSVAITVQNGGAGRPLADALVKFARSNAAQAIVSQDGFISKRGY